MARESDAISPTAHYTGYTWFAHGMSHPALVTPHGRLLYGIVSPARAVLKVVGMPTAQALLLARHQLIDLMLERAIDEGRVTQVIEVAAGLSPRGWHFKQRYGDKLRYIEADLPDMARRKRAMLTLGGLTRPGHEVVPLDALVDTGPLSLPAIAATLDHSQGTAIITEGLLMYFDLASVQGMWARFAKVLGGFPHGLYLSDLHLSHNHQNMGVKAFTGILSAFVRGQVHLSFVDEAQALADLHKAGFGQAALHKPEAFASAFKLPLTKGSEMVQVIEARTR
jgi:O-methyltransferase involved in polyketide biosynthesis